MRASTFDRLLPWTGAVAGLGWIGYASLNGTAADDRPGGATTDAIQGALLQNHASVACLVLWGSPWLLRDRGPHPAAFRRGQ
jgi:hypothetical protein